MLSFTAIGFGIISPRFQIQMAFAILLGEGNRSERKRKRRRREKRRRIRRIRGGRGREGEKRLEGEGRHNKPFLVVSLSLFLSYIFYYLYSSDVS